MKWKVIDTGNSSAEENMEYDRELLAAIKVDDSPILHLYGWTSPSATYGHFIKPEDYFLLDSVKKHGLNLAKRPTGGGIVFHTTDLAFSMLVPANHKAFSVNTLENYAFINRIVIDAIEHFQHDIASMQLLPQEPIIDDLASRNFCMAKPTRYDVMLAGRKLGGAAQRRSKTAFLHQGTISLLPPQEDLLLSVLKGAEEIVGNMLKNSHFLLSKASTDEDLEEARETMKQALRNAIA